MIIIRNITKNAEGGYDAAWSLSDEQMSYLLTYAINALLQEGVLSIQDTNSEEENEQAQQLSLLDALEQNDLPQA